MWDYDSLYQKAKLFVRKGLEHEAPHSPEIPLWCILALELLGRATLSKIHPALLADPKDGVNLLFACGFPSKKAPTSIPSKTVFHRCVVVCRDFSEDDYNRCMAWMNLRNEELHTGSLPFEELKTSTWLPDFFRICAILLNQNGVKLENFVGAEHASTANEMVESLSLKKRQETHSTVEDKRREFLALGIEDRLARIKRGKTKAKTSWSLLSRSKEIKCPACEGVALIVGDLIRSTTPKDSDGELIQESVWLPSRLVCFCCDLKLMGHAQVAALGFGDQFVTTEVLDPKEYYGIEFDPSEYYQSEYQNE